MLEKPVPSTLVPSNLSAACKRRRSLAWSSSNQNPAKLSVLAGSSSESPSKLRPVVSA